MAHPNHPVYPCVAGMAGESQCLCRACTAKRKKAPPNPDKEIGGAIKSVSSAIKAIEDSDNDTCSKLQRAKLLKAVIQVERAYHLLWEARRTLKK